MGTHDQRPPAEIYEELFVPALFQHWTAVVADVASIKFGDRVLDVACGTGVLARKIREIVGDGGSVTGLDVNAEMLAVARRVGIGVEWKQGQAEALPFDDGQFDAVVSQFGFMFFEDQTEAIREMMRVLKPGARIVIAVCDAIDHSPGYAVLTELLYRLFGSEAANAFRAPFQAGDPELLLTCFRDAGVSNATVERHDGHVHFASADSLISAERACAWTLGGLLDDAQFEKLRVAARESFGPFTQADDSVKILMPALIASATK